MRKEVDPDIQSWYESWYAIDRYYAEWAQRRGLTDISFYILRTIWENPEHCTPHYLCEKLILSKQTVSSALSSLAAKGYLIRQEDPSDRRNRLLSLTETGERLIQRLREELNAAERQAFESMDESSRRGLVGGNRLLAERLHDSLLGGK